jgi:hypothetical protein
MHRRPAGATQLQLLASSAAQRVPRRAGRAAALRSRSGCCATHRVVVGPNPANTNSILTAATKYWKGVTFRKYHPLNAATEYWKGVTSRKYHPLNAATEYWKGVTFQKYHPLNAAIKYWKGVTFRKYHPLTAATEYWKGVACTGLPPNKEVCLQRPHGVDTPCMHAGVDTDLLVPPGCDRSDVHRLQARAPGARWVEAVPAVHDARAGRRRRGRGGQSAALPARCCQGRPPAPSPGGSFQLAFGGTVQVVLPGLGGHCNADHGVGPSECL